MISDFTEKISLLLLTTTLSGLLIPYLLKKRDERKLREQKLFEAELARQGKIIDAQAKLLEDLAQLLWGMQLLALELPYYVLENSQDRYHAAATKYDIESWTYLAKLRVEISKARRLVSAELYQQLNDFYMKELIPLDGKISILMKSASANKEWAVYREARRNDWAKHHELIFTGLGKRIDELLNLLASEFLLISFEKDVKHPNGQSDVR